MIESNDDETLALNQALWAAMNLLMQLIRAQDIVRGPVTTPHRLAIEDRVHELGTALEALRRLSTWPDEDEVSRDE